MESVITKLSEIEIAAERIMDYAQQQKKEMEKEMEQRSAKFDVQVEADTAARLEALRQELQGQMEKELVDLKVKTEQTLNAMERNYQENHERLSEGIFQEIIRM
ncbi:MAG TPA: hypothetical protein IAB98_07555 [Candidatus Egerieimonas intestinavium]|uniref:ATPase n=1 Tax=Candidatus Egerieimonas intestinavium TaxID=2840777 RepID=A0A9D1EKG6_9FIRM|nr:hypothetical protein [Candidatus Egerieimonas intestinavium]